MAGYYSKDFLCISVWLPLTYQVWTCPSLSKIEGSSIRIINGCELRIENDVRKLTARHHQACRMNDADQLAWEMEISILTKQPLWILFFCRTCVSMADLNAQVPVHSSVNSYPGCLVSATPLTIVPIFLKLCRGFLHGMGMCMWFGYNC